MVTGQFLFGQDGSDYEELDGAESRFGQKWRTGDDKSDKPASIAPSEPVAMTPPLVAMTLRLTPSSSQTVEHRRRARVNPDASLYCFCVRGNGVHVGRV